MYDNEFPKLVLNFREGPFEEDLTLSRLIIQKQPIYPLYFKQNGELRCIDMGNIRNFERLCSCNEARFNALYLWSKQTKSFVHNLSEIDTEGSSEPVDNDSYLTMFSCVEDGFQISSYRESTYHSVNEVFLHPVHNQDVKIVVESLGIFWRFYDSDELFEEYSE